MNGSIEGCGSLINLASFLAHREGGRTRRTVTDGQGERDDDGKRSDFHRNVMRGGKRGKIRERG